MDNKTEITEIAKIWQKLTRNISKTSNKIHEVELRYKLIDSIKEAVKVLGEETIVYSIEKKVKTGGFADAIVNGVLIETKNYNLLENQYNKDKFTKQTLKYMKSEGLKYGILIDFVRVIFFTVENNGEVSKTEKIFSLETFVEIIELLTQKNRIKFISAIELVHDFSPQREPAKSLIKELYKLLEKGIANNNSKVKLLFDEWEKLFKLSGERSSNRPYEKARIKALSRHINISFEESKEYLILFSLHTGLSLILKTLIATILSKLLNLQNQNDMENDIRNFYKLVESGELFRRAGIKNFCNYDFFSWYLELDWDSEFLQSLQKIKYVAELYEHLKDRDVKDVLQDLYFEFIPREVRHSFGEYYTPVFIADYMVKEVGSIIDKKDFTAIDPTCGSGTFLMSLIKYKKMNAVKLNDIAKQVFGIDLNPIAILMAKFNYVNILFDLYRDADAYIEPVEIPVYIGDSSYTPSKEIIDGIECITYQYYFYKSDINMPKIVFPVEFVSSEKFTDVLIEVERKIEQNQNPQKIIKYLLQEIEQTIKRKLSKSLENYIEELIKTIIDYHKRNLNMIWLYIFMNYLRPFAKDGYDVIIGNPPWVRWSNLPESYREKIKRTLREEGLFSKDRNYGGVDLNICALVGYKAAENFSNSKSIVFFVLPQGILVNKSFEGFRKWIYGPTLCEPKRVYKPRVPFFSGEEPIMLMLLCSKNTKTGNS